MPEPLIDCAEIKSNQTKSKRGGKRTGAGRKRNATDQAIADTVAVTGSITATAQRTHSAPVTVKAILASPDWPGYRDQAAGKWARVRESALDLAQRRLDVMQPDDMTTSNILQLATTAGIGEDKIAKLTGLDGSGLNYGNTTGPHLTQNKLELHVHQASTPADGQTLARSVALLLNSGISKPIPPKPVSDSE